MLVKWQITYIHRKFLGFLFSVIILIWTFWDSKLGYNFKVKKIDENLGSINLTNIDNLIKIVHVGHAFNILPTDCIFDGSFFTPLHT